MCHKCNSRSFRDRAVRGRSYVHSAVSAGFIYVLVTWGLSLQSQGVDPEQFSSQDSSLMLEQKTPVFPQQYASQAQVAQGSYTPMQDPSFHTMGQRPSYATLRMQPRPGLRPTGLVQSQPNQLRLQLQHRLQAQQVCSWLLPRKSGWGDTVKVDVRWHRNGGSFWGLKSHSVLRH